MIIEQAVNDKKSKQEVLHLFKELEEELFENRLEKVRRNNKLVVSLSKLEEIFINTHDNVDRVIKDIFPGALFDHFDYRRKYEVDPSSRLMKSLISAISNNDNISTEKAISGVNDYINGTASIAMVDIVDDRFLENYRPHNLYFPPGSNEKQKIEYAILAFENTLIGKMKDVRDEAVRTGNDSVLSSFKFFVKEIVPKKNYSC